MKNKLKTNSIKFHLVFLTLYLSASFSGCGSTFPEDTTPRGTISGSVRTIDNTKSIRGVDVRVEGSTAISDKTGRFNIFDFPETERTVVIFEKEDYIPAIRIIDVQDKKTTDLHINLMKQEQFFDLDSGIDATLPPEANEEEPYGSITIPADSLAYLDEETNKYKPFNGPYKCSFTVINPADEHGKDIFPGDFSGIPCEESDCSNLTGVPAPLISYGYFNLVLMDTQNGRKLQLAENKSATISIPIPEQLIPTPGQLIPIDLPSEMGFWSFNEDDGIWIQKGWLTLSDKGDAYGGEVNHFSFFGAAEVYDPVTVTGTILDCDIEDPLDAMNPFNDVEVVITGEDPFNTWKSVQKLTNSDGSFSIPCYPNSNAKIHIIQNGKEFTLNSVDSEFKTLLPGSEMDRGAIAACSGYKQVEVTVEWSQHPSDLDMEMIFVPEEEPEPPVINPNDEQLLLACKQELSAGGASALDGECIEILEKYKILERLWYKKPTLENAILVNDGSNGGSRGNKETIQILELIDGSYTFKVKHYAGINTISSASSGVKATLTIEDYSSGGDAESEALIPGSNAKGVNDVWRLWEVTVKTVDGKKVKTWSQINEISYIDEL